MSTVELEAYVQELAQENPIIDLEPPRSEQEAPRDQELFRRVKWLEDSDRQNRYYQRLDAEELDPLAQVGTDGGLEESLSNFLFRQIQQLDLDESAKQLLCYLSACLDEDGYFRIPLDELSRTSGISQRRLARTLELLRSLEPAGVGASSLSQCLELQLLRIHEEGPALAIVRDCLEELAKNIIMPSPPVSPSLRRRSAPPNRADPRAESPSRFHLRAPQRDLLYSAGYFDRRDGRTFHCPPAEQ